MPRRDPTPALTRLVAEQLRYAGGPGQMAIDARRELRLLTRMHRAAIRDGHPSCFCGVCQAAFALQRLTGKGRP